MFKPTNPKLDMLLAKIKETKNKQNELDAELTELPWIYSELEDLEKEIAEIDKKVESLEKQKKFKNKEVKELKTKISEKNIQQMQNDLELFESQVQKMESEVSRIINEDFKTYINTMTDENTMTRYLSSGTQTTPIMDMFINDKEKDFLVLRGVFPDKDLVIGKKQQGIIVENVSAPTMTELKMFRYRHPPKRMLPLLDELKKYDNLKIKEGQKVQFDTPLPLGAQTYANQTGYGWEWDWSNGYGSYTEGTYYGEVTTFLIIGFIKNY